MVAASGMGRRIRGRRVRSGLASSGDAVLAAAAGMGRPFVLRCDDCVTSDADTCSGIVWPHGSPGGVRRFGRTAARYPAIAQPYGGYPSVVRPGDHTAPRLSTRQRHKMDTVRQPSSTTKPAVADGFITTVPPAGLEPASPKAMDFKSTASTNSAKGATVLC